MIQEILNVKICSFNFEFSLITLKIKRPIIGNRNKKIKKLFVNNIKFNRNFVLFCEYLLSTISFNLFQRLNYCWNNQPKGGLTENTLLKNYYLRSLVIIKL